MARKVKCPICETMNNKEETITHNGRYYCKDCYETKEQDADGYKRLITYICDLYKIDRPTGMILKQIKDFKSEYNFTDDGIYMTLRYYYKLMDNKVIDGVGIGIVPYYYEKAKQQYLTLVNVEDMVKQYKNDHIRTININTKARNKVIDRLKRRIIDFDGIDWGELDD